MTLQSRQRSLNDALALATATQESQLLEIKASRRRLRDSIRQRRHRARHIEVETVDFTYVSFSSGIGGAEESLRQAIALKGGIVEGVRVSPRRLFACDIDPLRVVAYNAVCTAHGDADTRAVVADITDVEFFSDDFLSSLSDKGVDTLFSCLLCKSVSKAGGRKGLIADELYINALLRIIKIINPQQIFLECVSEVENDVDYNRLVMEPLHELGFDTQTEVFFAAKWGGVERKRWALGGIQQRREYLSLSPFPQGPVGQQREIVLSESLLLPYKIDAIDAEKRAPLWCYETIGGVHQRIDLGAGALAAATLPLLRNNWRSRVMNYQFDEINILVNRHNTAPTLLSSSSGKHRLRDTFGSRYITAKEEGSMHGYSVVTIDALRSALSETNMLSAIGDGFPILPMRDALNKMLIARIKEKMRK
jgi:site-specific DNA-cytosine methylase